MRPGSRFHRVFWHSSDKLPSRLHAVLWRPYCWMRRKHGDNYYGACVYCFKDLDG